jgi:hypothetical protein
VSTGQKSPSGGCKNWCVADLGEGLKLLGAVALLIGGIGLAAIVPGWLARLFVLAVAILAAAYVAGLLPSIQLPF